MEAGTSAPQRGISTLRALSHPVRIRIIEVLTERGPLSPTDIVNGQLCSDLESVRSKTYEQQVSHISYHCRKLEEAELVTLVRRRPVRGATEHFYSANQEAVFSDEDWASLDREEREDISAVMWHRFVAQVEIARHKKTFDSRVTRWLAWGPLDLDEEGWRQLTSSAADWYATVERIRTDARARLDESGDDPVSATYGIFAFESAPNR